MIMSGCGARKNETYVKPSISSLPVQDGQALGSAKYPLAASIGEGRFEVYYQGYGVRKVSDSWPQPSIRIQISCENSSDETLLFDTSSSHIVDNRGDVLRCSGAKMDGALAESFAEVRPHSHSQFDLFYDLKQGYPLEKLESFKVYWRYKGGEQSVANHTMFVRYPAKKMLYRDENGKSQSFDYFMAIQDVVPGKVAK
jgi:hypothetical protein